MGEAKAFVEFGPTRPSEFTFTPDDRVPAWRTTIGGASARIIEHLTDGRPLYIPGYGDTGGAEHFTPTLPPTLRLHPTRRAQLPIIAGHFDTLTEPAIWFVSVAHLAHRDCHACEHVWHTDTCDYEFDATPCCVFINHPLNATAPTYLLLHLEDR